MARDDPAESARPGSEAELARMVADAQRRGLKVSPRGGATKSDWGGPVDRVDLAVSTLSLNRVLEHAAGDMTVTVEAGCTIAALQQTLARQGQRLASDPIWPDRATVGGVLAANDSGSLRHAFGPLRDLVLGVTVALPDGTLARSGGKVVKNVAGYDLPKLMTGAFGTLGIVTRATFRVHPLPRESRTFEFTAFNPVDAGRFMRVINDSPVTVTGLQVVARRVAPCAVALRVEGSPAGVEASSTLVVEVAAACGFAPSPEWSNPWCQSQRLWDLPGSLAKVTFPPSQFSDLCALVPGALWTLVAQGVGVGWVATDAGPDDLAGLAERLQALGGSLLVFRGDPQLKRRVNMRTLAGVLPLMRRVKEQFDPLGTLNPGTFGGGI